MKRITLEEAKESFFPKPSSMSVMYVDSFSLTPDPYNPEWEIVNYWCSSNLFNAQLSLNEGYIYILENKSQPGILKIGYTNRTPQDRVREINSGTGVIIPWYVVSAYPCMSPQHIETIIHQILSPYHINKEGYGVSLSKAEEVILKVIEDNKAAIK